MEAHEYGSPAKRRKQDARQDPHSQGSSKATSTPTRKSLYNKPESPNLSVIGSEIEVRSHASSNDTVVSSKKHNKSLEGRTQSSESEEDLAQPIPNEAPEAESASIHESVDPEASIEPVTADDDNASVCSASYEEIIEEHVYYKGKLWKLFKPTKDRSLYARILTQPSDISDIVSSLIAAIEKNPEKVMTDLVELFADLCGYQEVDVICFYKLSIESGRLLVRKMESEEMIPESVKKTGNYFFKEARNQSKLGKVLLAAVFCFFEKLILVGFNEDVIFSAFFSKHLFSFIEQMCLSIARPIRHTGLLVLIKIFTTLTHIRKEILQTVSHIPETNKRLSWTNQRRNIDVYVNFFYNIFKNNCLIGDPVLYKLKVDNAKEMLYWMKNMPENFVNPETCLGLLKKLILDPNKDVRLAAMTTFRKLVNEKELNNFLRPHVEELATVVAGRFDDVIDEVVRSAIGIFKVLLKCYSKIALEYFLKIIPMIYINNYFIAKEAADFYISFLEFYKTTNDDQNVYSKIIGIALNKNYYPLMPLLVEASCEYNWELNKWGDFVESLINDDLTIKERKGLFELAYHAVNQHLTGISVYRRKLTVDEGTGETHKDIGTAFLKHSKDILIKYADDEKVLIQYSKILNLINYRYLGVESHKEYQIIIRYYQKLFLNTSNVELIKNIVKLFSTFAENIPDFEQRAKQLIWSYLDNICTRIKEKLTGEISDETNEDVDMLLKISLIYKSFDLNEHFSWEVLMDYDLDLPIEDKKLRLACCRGFLLWKLKLIDQKSFDRQLNRDELKKLKETWIDWYKKYIQKSTNLLKTAYETKNENGFEIFRLICKFCISCKEIFKKDLFIGFSLTLSVDEENELGRFLDQRILTNQDLYIKTKRDHVENFFALMCGGIISQRNAGYIFKLYVSKAELYGAHIERFATKLYEFNETALILVVIETLFHCFDKSFNDARNIDVGSGEAKSLKALARKFSSLKEFQSSTVVSKIFSISLKYCQVINNFNQFMFFRTFAKCLNGEDTISLLEKLKELPAEIRSTVPIVMLRSQLEAKNKAKKAAQDSKQPNAEDSQIPLPTNETFKIPKARKKAQPKPKKSQKGRKIDEEVVTSFEMLQIEKSAKEKVQKRLPKKVTQKKVSVDSPVTSVESERDVSDHNIAESDKENTI